VSQFPTTITSAAAGQSPMRCRFECSSIPDSDIQAALLPTAFKAHAPMLSLSFARNAACAGVLTMALYSTFSHRRSRRSSTRATISAKTAYVLKVGHHGSRYASTPAFIADVRPSIAVISVGRHNTFGNPAISTLETLGSNQTSIYRTDRCGAVSVPGSPNISTILQCQEHLSGMSSGPN
jgi:hypothetical protein